MNDGVRFNGWRVLVVEDEAMIAGLIEAILSDAGCSVLGPIASARRALETIAHERIDAVLLDISIDGNETYPVADLLAARGIPFIFVSGYAQRDMPAKYRRCAYLTKPFEPDAMLALLDKTVRGAGGQPDRAG